MTTAAQTDTASQFYMVGMADFAVSHDPAVVLCSYPLGACLGVAVYDPVVKVAGFLHSLLPASAIDPNRAAARPAMFLDSGMRAMISRVYEMGGLQDRLLVIVAGGSQIMDETSLFNIGKRNREVLTNILAELNLKIHTEDVGGRSNRTMQIDVVNGTVRVKYSGQAASKTICKP